ncbi:MAG: DNA replication complex GINS family protein [Candidatus Bathyarchaeota archaeon]|nr:MAG: DNA replication complex GINS family protein [Candidatus Bathyarchaeota archaeon]
MLFFDYTFYILPTPSFRRLEEGKELPSRYKNPVQTADFKFTNKPVKVTANRNEEKIELAGLDVGPFEEGREYEVRFWVARELERAGIVRFRGEDMLDVVKLHKIRWKEKVQPTNKVSSLPAEFYPRLRRYLSYLQEAPSNTSEKLKNREKSTSISQDIVNCRVKKIVSLASSPPLTAQTLQNLTPEERSLYHCLHGIINDWRAAILKF